MNETLFLVQEAYAGGGDTNVGSGAALIIAVGALLVVALIASMLKPHAGDDAGGPLNETHKAGPDKN